MISNNEVTNKVGWGKWCGGENELYKQAVYSTCNYDSAHLILFCKAECQPGPYRPIRSAAAMREGILLAHTNGGDNTKEAVINWITLKFINMSQIYRRPTQGRRSKQLHTKYINLREKWSQEHYGRIVTHSFWPILTDCASLHCMGVDVNMTPFYLVIKSCRVIKSLLHSGTEGSI